MHVWDFLGEVVPALEEQLRLDETVHGDEWIKNPRDGQEDRIFNRLDEYYLDWFMNEVPVPWLKIMGLAMIGWLRDHHPEIWSK